MVPVNRRRDGIGGGSGIRIWILGTTGNPDRTTPVRTVRTAIERCRFGTRLTDVVGDQSGWGSACPSERGGDEYPAGLRFVATLAVGLSLGESCYSLRREELL